MALAWPAAAQQGEGSEPAPTTDAEQETTAEEPAAPEPSDTPRDRARKLATDGIAAYQEGRYDEALSLLGQAEQLFHAPTHLLYMARAHAKSARPREAYQTYVRVVVERLPNYAPEAFFKAQRVAKREAEALRPKLALVQVELDASGGVVVRVDGNVVDAELLTLPLALTAGQHRVGFYDPSDDAELVRMVAAERGEIVRVDNVVREDPAATGPFNHYPVATGVALGIGAAAVIAGAITGGLSWQRTEEIRDTCVDDSCPPEQADAGAKAERLGHASTVLFAVGGASLALGLGLMIADVAIGGGDAPASALRLHFGPTGVIIEGAL